MASDIKPEITVAAALIFREGTVLVTRRKKNAHLGGYWEFPGGKIKSGETLEQCLVRELTEELGIQSKVRQRFFSTSHGYPEKIVHLHFFICDILSGAPRPQEAIDLAWVKPDQLSNYQLPPADHELVQKLQKGELSW